ncbi:MAG: hypothetical protein DWQ07_11380 [Chloroflexi bacterium]|nr:MAG: hypothetical protein DWQ07_11380 [Chloroflexota bacterium]MBL1197288.1 hypothetical protein [Chloroflexota bacterium]NOH14583.1 hypothetical protein [Chloroflexota bacterium]
MENIILLATRNGLVIVQSLAENTRDYRTVLPEQILTSVIAREGVILVGSRQGVQRSNDGGETWRFVNEGLDQAYIRWLAYHPDISDFEVAGTEPAGIFISTDGAESWRDQPEVADLREQHGWRLPYSPGAGAVRGLTFNGHRLYAAVEVGGILRSDDAGKTWQLAGGSSGVPSRSSPAKGQVHADVYDVAVHPQNPDLVFAATGGGLFRSYNGGENWENLYRCYCRSLWLDPENPQHIIFGPADYVGSIGRIETSHDGGTSWQNGSGNLDVPWPKTMVEHFTQAGDNLYAVLDNGCVLTASLETLDWMYAFEDVEGVNAITVMG